MRHSVCILGATGSIGASTLDILRQHPEQFHLHAVSAHANLERLASICAEFKPDVAVVTSGAVSSQSLAAVRAASPATQLLIGAEHLTEIAAASDSDTLVAAIVGAAGLLPTLAAVNAGKRVLLANKEALVMTGQLFVDAVAQSGATLLPIDSEHNAIFQALPEALQQRSTQADLAQYGVSKLLLTGSGGPFLNTPLDQLAAVTPAQACKHPNWSMGQKISVDSATMMNKGLEFIEARWLFNASDAQIEVIIHPQSVIHSMVQYTDGSVIAQLGQPDMRTPIAHALSFPARIDSGVAPLDFTQLGALSFDAPDFSRFPCLKLAMQASLGGQRDSTVLNAANEVAVAAFLAGQLSFTQISCVVEQALTALQSEAANDLEAILALDTMARTQATAAVKRWGQA